MPRSGQNGVPVARCGSPARGPIRQIVVTGLGRDRPTLLLSNHFRETPRELTSAMRAATGSRTAWASA